MAEHDLLGPHTSLHEQLSLLEGHLTELTVRRHRTTHLCGNVRGGNHDPALGIGNLILLSRNLSDNARAHAGLPDAL